METMLDFIDASKRRTFLICLIVSLGIHVFFIATLLPFAFGGKHEAGPAGIAERLAHAINTASDVNAGWRSQIDGIIDGVKPNQWNKSEMAATLIRAGKELGIPIKDSDVLRALDPERAREGRWDIRVWISWENDRDAGDLLAMAYLVGEGTLRSDFGSHRLWIHLEAEDGSGRAAFETMDCRNYKAGKINASDLLYKYKWIQP